MTGIADLVIAGKEFGIFQFYLPFVILFAILYGLLQKSKIFGTKVKAINIIISLAASLFVMEYALSGVLATFFASFFAGTLAILITILGFLMVTWLMLAIFSEEVKLDAKKYAKFVVIIGAVLAAATFLSSGGTAIFPGFVIPGVSTETPLITFPPGLNLSTQDVGIILLVVLFVGIVIFLVKSGGGKESKEEKPHGWAWHE